jgi:hypothetical protein
MQYPQDNLLLQACRTLFGQDIILNREFLTYLQPSGAKTAYRNQVKAHHPDRFGNAPPHVRQRQTERFREIHQAYDLLKNFLDGRQAAGRPSAWAAPRAQKPAAPSKPYTSSRQQRARASAFGQQTRIPAIPLEYGMFAYYSGKITYQDLIQGLIWQRRQRPALGVIARQWGWLTDAQVHNILRHRGHSQRFGKKAIEMKQLRPHQVEALLAHQRSQQQKLGQFFIEEGLMNQLEANRLARQLEQHNAHLRNAAY